MFVKTPIELLYDSAQNLKNGLSKRVVQRVKGPAGRLKEKLMPLAERLVRRAVAKHLESINFQSGFLSQNLLEISQILEKAGIMPSTCVTTVAYSEEGCVATVNHYRMKNRNLEWGWHQHDDGTGFIYLESEEDDHGTVFRLEQPFAERTWKVYANHLDGFPKGTRDVIKGTPFEDIRPLRIWTELDHQTAMTYLAEQIRQLSNLAENSHQSHWC